MLPKMGDDGDGGAGASNGILSGKRRKSAPAQSNPSSSSSLPFCDPDTCYCLLAKTSETRLRAVEVQLDRILQTEKRLNEIDRSLTAVQAACEHLHHASASTVKLRDETNNRMDEMTAKLEKLKKKLSVQADARVDNTKRMNERMNEMTSKLEALSVHANTRIDQVSSRLDALCQSRYPAAATLSQLSMTSAQTLGVAYGQTYDPYDPSYDPSYAPFCCSGSSVPAVPTTRTVMAVRKV
tara:strand:- start:946 stop:1662 length:717 start_codon:yes stop_codon:yes gene_type:complete